MLHDVVLVWPCSRTRCCERLATPYHLGVCISSFVSQDCFYFHSFCFAFAGLACTRKDLNTSYKRSELKIWRSFDSVHKCKFKIDFLDLLWVLQCDFDMTLRELCSGDKCIENIL